jgi:1-acyl-sn-glycerol-3-phosphate acyltransferase
MSRAHAPGSSSALASLFAVYKTFSISLPTVIEALAGRVSMERSDRRLDDWSRSIVRRAEIDLVVSGAEHIPRDRACVYMSNHQSHFDIPIIYSVFPGTLRMVAKAELFKVPIFGRAMRDAGFVKVDRSGDRQQAVEAMRSCGDALARGINIWMAPEGTRSVDGRLGKFKKGGFMLAREAGAEIVPIAIDGSRNILPKNTLVVQRGARVHVTFGAPFPTVGRDTQTLMHEVRAFFEAHVTQPPATT